MRCFAVVLLAVSAGAIVACSEGGGSFGPEICDAKQVVDCGDVPPDDVGGVTFVAGLGTARCSDDGGIWDTTACTRIGGGFEFQYCQGRGNNDCDDGLTCVPTGVSTRQCLTPCTDDASCGTGRICTDYATSRYCFAAASTGQSCFADRVCVSPGDRCRVTGASVGIRDDGSAFIDTQYGACSRLCPGADVGRAGGSVCTASETCIASAFEFDFQRNGSNEVQCNTANPDDTSCNQQVGFSCITVQRSSGQQDLCARPAGICIGQVLPVASTKAAIDAVYRAVEANDRSSVCFLPPVSNSSGALGQLLVGNAACGVTGATGLPAEVACKRLYDDQQVGVCVGYCDGPAGELRDCGLGYHCEVPEQQQVALADIQVNGTETVTCNGYADTTSCNTGGGFICLQAGAGTFYCGKPNAVCVKD